MPDARLLPLSKVCVKAAHNSYDPSKHPLARQLNWDVKRKHEGGCCGVELDVVQADAKWAWSVQHGGKYEGQAARQLKAFLGELDTWSAGRGGDHPPTFIHFDLKNSPNSDRQFALEFDRYIMAGMPGSRFFRPGDLLGDAPNLLVAAQVGWPSVNELWGRFICCLSGSELDRTWTYLDESLQDRLCFADRDVNATVVGGGIFPEDQPNRIIYNFRFDRLGAISSLVAPEFRPALLFRAYEVNDDVSWKRAQMLGVNLLATDQVFFTSWAHAGDDTQLRALL